MRVALVTSPLLFAALLFACATFSSGNDAPPPPGDAGVDTNVTPADECVPVVVDPSAPQECTDDLQTSAVSCGTCGHACVDSPCQEGRCVADRITENAVGVFALDGSTLYTASGADILRADLTKRPVAFETFFSGIFGTMSYLEAYAGELYVSTSQQPTIIRISDQKQRGNDFFPAVNTTRGDGIFFPGRIAYYLHARESGFDLARIDTTNQSVRYKSANDFLPVSRAGDELYWTEKLSSGAQIWGAWDDDKPVVNVGEEVKGFVADGRDVYFVSGGFVRRARQGVVSDIAQETGQGLAFAIAGSELFYLVKRALPGEDHYQVYRVDACRGGRPILVYESVNTPASRIVVEGTTHVLISTDLGIFRVRK